MMDRGEATTTKCKRFLASTSGLLNSLLWHGLPWWAHDLLREWTGGCFVIQWDGTTRNVECRWVDV